MKKRFITNKSIQVYPKQNLQESLYIFEYQNILKFVV